MNSTIDRTYLICERSAVMPITANDLKTRGVATIHEALKDQDEVIISVRGQDRYVVMDISTYNQLRVCELEAAYYQAQRELAEGQGVEEPVDQHMARILKLDE